MTNQDKDTKWYQDNYGWFDGDFTGTKSHERVRKYAEVYTPRWVVEMMCDLVETDLSECNKTVFEPCCGEGAFLTSVLRRKLEKVSSMEDKIRCCQVCYGVDIQYDNVIIARQKCVDIATSFGVDVWEARFIFARNIVHGDMLFFPMIVRFYDWENDEWTTLEEMGLGDN